MGTVEMLFLSSFEPDAVIASSLSSRPIVEEISFNIEFAAAVMINRGCELCILNNEY